MDSEISGISPHKQATYRASHSTPGCLIAFELESRQSYTNKASASGQSASRKPESTVAVTHDNGYPIMHPIKRHN